MHGLLLLALTQGSMFQTGESPVRGLTADGTAFVYTVQREDLAPEVDETGERPSICQRTYEVVRDLKTPGADQTFLRMTEGARCAAGPQLAWDVPRFQAFLAAHPLSPFQGQTGPHGAKVVGAAAACAHVTASAEVVGVYADEDERCTGEDGYNRGTLDLVIARPVGRSTPLWHSKVHRMNEGNHFGVDSAAVFWTPDESQVALVRWVGTSGFRGSGHTDQEIHVVKLDPARPHVSVLGWARKGAAPKAEQVAAAVAEQLKGLPYDVTSGVAKDPRTDTVVYAAPGFEADAAKIAALLPGARVEKLTWKADAEMVVAVAGK